MLPLPRRRRVAPSVRTQPSATAVAAARVARRVVAEMLESRTLLAASIYESDAPFVAHGPQPQVRAARPAPLGVTANGTGVAASGDSVTAVGRGTAGKGQPLTESPVAPSVVNGVVFSNLNGPYVSWDPATDILGFDDYDSINNATINLSQMKFIGGVQNPGGTLEFEFYDASGTSLMGEFHVSFPDAGNFLYPITPPAGFTIPDAGIMQVRAQAGTTAQWFESTVNPSPGTQNPNIGPTDGYSHKFEFTNTSTNQPPVVTALSDTPDPVAAGGTITLTATGVGDPDGSIANVRFYRETNGIAGLQTTGASDVLLGTDTTASPYSLSVAAPAVNGAYTYYAQATDNLGLAGNAAVTTNTVGVGSITGTVWNDANNNQVKDVGEAVLSGWTVFLDANRNQIRDNGETFTTSNASGVYTFSNLAAETYFVTTEIPTGWTQTSPGAVGRVSAATAGEVTVEGAAAAPIPPKITTTGSRAPIFLSDGSSAGPTSFTTSGEMQPYDAQSNSLIRLTNFQADSRFNTIKGQGSAVAVLDTGIDLDHPAFGPDSNFDGVADRIIYDRDFANGDMDATDFNGHGTNVASIVGSQAAGYAGMAPNVNIIALKVFQDNGSGLFSYTEAALQWVVANASAYNITAINMSLGDNGNYNTNQTLNGLNDELAALAAQNVMVISAAGNDFFPHGSAPGVAYPAADPNSLAVSAVWDGNNGSVSWASGAIDHSTAADRVTSFSQRSTAMTDIFAPGAMITGGNYNGGTVDMGGTSQAAPHIAGIAALAQQLAVRDLGRRLTMAEFRTLMINSGVSINDGDDENDNVTNTGGNYKRVDVLALGEAIRAMAVSPYTHTVTLSPGENATNINFGNRTADATAPTADIVDVSPDPRLTAAGTVTVNFSENVTGVDKGDFSLTRDGASVSLAAATFAPVTPSQYTLDLTGVTGQAGLYVLSLNPGAANNIEDAGGNDFTVAATDTWLKNAVDGTGAADTIKLVRSGAAINVFINNATATPSYAVNAANLGANVLHVLGAAGNDTINLDFAGGVPAATPGLDVDGGGQTSADTLILTGTTAAESATFTTTNFNFGATPITHTGVEAHAYAGGTTGVDTLNVNGGTFQFPTDARDTTANLNVNVGPAGTVVFNATQHLNDLTVAGNASLAAGGAKKIVTKGLSVTGKLNLRNHDLIYDYSGASPIGTPTGGVYNGVTGALQSAYQEGSWGGNGIMTDEENALAALTTLGIAEAADIFGLGGSATTNWEGETVDATAVLIKYTWAGDTNFDGKLDADDYGTIDFSVLVSGSFGYYAGDFTFDGKVDADDYGLIDFNILAQDAVL